MKLRVIVFVALVAALGMVVGESPASSPAGAQSAVCPDGSDPDPETGECPIDRFPECVWRQIDGNVPPTVLRMWFPNAPDNAIFWWRDCGTGASGPCGSSVNCDPLSGVEDPIDVTWTLPGAPPPAASPPGGGPPGGGPPPPPPPPPPGLVAAGLAGDIVQGPEVDLVLEDPVVDVYPRLEDAAVVTVPTFVAVTNWPDGGAVTGGPNCGTSSAGEVCVEMTATPTLTFDPGEEGAAVVDCEPGGTLYQVGGAEPREQAAAADAGAPSGRQACVHGYGQRTGVAGRPGEWPGVATVIWEVTWTTTIAGEEVPIDLDYVLDDIDAEGGVVRSVDLPRRVEEAQSVVAESSPGAG